jgi:hypothetical protein
MAVVRHAKKRTELNRKIVPRKYVENGNNPNMSGWEEKTPQYIEDLLHNN